MADANLDGAVSCYFPSPLNEPPINQRAQLRPTCSVETKMLRVHWSVVRQWVIFLSHLFTNMSLCTPSFAHKLHFNISNLIMVNYVFALASICHHQLTFVATG